MIYFLEVFKTDLHSKVYYRVRVSCLEEGRIRRWIAKKPIDELVYLNILILFHLCFRCDWQAVIAQIGSKIYNGKSAQYCEAVIETSIISLDFVRSKMNFTNPSTKPLARRLVNETSRRIGLISKLWHCDWYPIYVIRDSMNRF
jgi:hypothetical protein